MPGVPSASPPTSNRSTRPTRWLPRCAARFCRSCCSSYPGLSYSFQGKQADTSESVTSLRNSALAALVIIYAMLAIPFRSYTQPILVMVAIPFGAVGALLGHLLMGFSLSVVSMMGIIALSGVVVNDSLVLIDYANRQRQRARRTERHHRRRYSTLSSQSC